MKKFISVLVAFLLVCALCGCEKDTQETTVPGTQPPATTATSPTTLPPTTVPPTTVPPTTVPPTTVPPTTVPPTTVPPTTVPPTTVPPTTVPPTTVPPTTVPPTTVPPATECNHTYSDASCTAPKTCTKCGVTEGAAKGHSWVDATCTAPKTCSVCKATEGAAKGHNWVDATCTAPKTCSVCKATEGAAKGHSWVDATCTAPKTCSVCKATEGAAKGHSYAEGKCTVCNEADPDFKALNTGCWEFRHYPNGNVVTHKFFFGTTANWENSWHYFYCQPATEDQIKSAKEEGGIDVEKYRHENGNYYLFGEGDSDETECSVNGNVITVKVYNCTITLERTAGNQLTATKVTGDLFVGNNGIKAGDVFTWRECKHNFNEGKCSSCGQIQENYKPLKTGKWQGAFVGEDGRLYNLNVCFQDDNKMIGCGYGAELSTLDPKFQADLLANPESLTEFEGKKYYIGSGDGMDIKVEGWDGGGFFEVPGFTPEQASAKVFFERIAGDQIKIIRVEGSVFGINAVEPDVILTWCES